MALTQQINDLLDQAETDQTVFTQVMTELTDAYQARQMAAACQVAYWPELPEGQWQAVKLEYVNRKQLPADYATAMTDIATAISDDNEHEFWMAVLRLSWMVRASMPHLDPLF